MSVTNVDILDSVGAINREGDRSYTVTYRVRTNDATDGPNVAKGYPGNAASAGGTTVPEFGDTYSYGTDYDYRAFLVDKSAELESRDESYKVWLITCNFATRQPQTCEDFDPNDIDPLLVPEIWSGSFAQHQAPAGVGFTYNRVQDRYQFQPVMNSAGDPYDPPVMVDDSRPLLRCVKNYPYVNIAVWNDFRDAVNAGPWLGFPARTVKVSAINWEQIYQGTCFPYVRATFEFELAANTWDVFILDQGYRQTDWTAATPTTTPILKGGLPVELPFLLDGQGQPLSEALINAGTFWYWQYRIYRERNFFNLGLTGPSNAVII